MRNLSTIGRIFYGLAIAAMGVQTIWTKRFPYMMIPPDHAWIPAFVTCIFGAMLVVAGICIVFGKKVRLTPILLGFALLLIFCFYFIPYEFMSGAFKSFGEWENAEKELALAGGAFAIADSFFQKNENSLVIFLTKLIPFGGIIFSLTIICFGIAHFMDAQGVADYMPTWVPFKIFWAYFCGAALIGSGIAIILKIKRGLVAALLGTMIFSWFVILHIPKVIAAPSAAEMRGELTSAFLALAYSGIAFAIAGIANKNYNSLK